MKRALLAAVFSTFIYGMVFAQDVAIDSKITEATIFPGSAMITRVALIKLNPGEHKVIFPGIIPEIDENSLKVSAENNPQVQLYGAQIKKEFLKEASSERIKLLAGDIERTKDSIRAQNDLKAVLRDEKSFLDSVRLFSAGQIPKDLVTRMPPAKDLDDTLKFLDTRLKENAASLMNAELASRELNKKLDALTREYAEVSGVNKKIKSSIVVDLEVLKAQEFNLSVSYLVQGAYWSPVYDARANFEKSEVELVSYGILSQRTGEDWQDVQVSLSTAKPAIGGRMPYVAPWFLRPFMPQKRHFDKGLAKSQIGMQYEAFYTDELDGAARASGAPAVKEEKYAQAEEKGIAVVYKLPKKANIKSDGSEHKLPVSTQVLKADFEYSTFPRAVPNAYLGSRVMNAPGLQLLAGRVNIFLDGDFVGSSSIDNIGPQEEFDLYLGVDESVKVKREQITKKVDDVLIAGIPSPTRKTSFKYKITIENYKNRKIKVLLFEAMPVSENDKIKVKTGEVSLEPKDKDWKDRKGVWRWELELDPRQKQEIIYNFIVEHPRDMQVEGI
ncbi:MAG: mucoidy inhibitor MuiA family protein [Candidatus Omnitrophica bacterium]|nr:mucoidy inhibitor MuiA family protein [Candidatus Omnitrophota bacterium]